MANPTYTKEEKATIKSLKAAGVELTGTESPDELRTLAEQQELENREEGTEAEVVDGVPNQLPVRTEKIVLNGKEHNLAVFFVATVKGGAVALYDYVGRRVSPAYGAKDPVDPTDEKSALGSNYINKAAAKYNAMRRRNIIPGEKTVG